jgi:polyisoprenoid-binding protein YceI
METVVKKTTKWALDTTHSELEFKVKHLMISNVKGSFTQFDASINGEDFTNSTVNVSINASSISTNNEDRDGHLRSADFLM